MATLFESGVAQYKKKFEGLVSNISAMSIESIARSRGVSMESLKTGLESNSQEFQQFCFRYASTLMPGRVSCTTYAAVVACIAKHFGVPYVAYSGFCLQKTSARYERDKADFERLKSEGKEHPMFATHVYTEINGVAYEYYNGDTSNVDHLDVVEIARA